MNISLVVIQAGEGHIETGAIGRLAGSNTATLFSTSNEQPIPWTSYARLDSRDGSLYVSIL
jgi:hypothetical protein